MRNHGGRRAILPLLLRMFTLAVVAGTTARAAASGTEPAPVGATVATPPPASPPPASPPPAVEPPTPAADAPAADAATPKAPEPVERRLVPSLSHDLQFALAVMPGDGYRIVIPYKDIGDCGDANNNMARVCTSRVPVFVDLQPSFGISESWDFLVDIRLGLEQNVFRHREVWLMPGFRYWLDTQVHVKFFTTLQLAYDATAQSTPQVSGSDIGVRNSNGLMVEVMRNFGAYVQFGETVGFKRWLSFGVDAGIGVQARVP